MASPLYQEETLQPLPKHWQVMYPISQMPWRACAIPPFERIGSENPADKIFPAGAAKLQIRNLNIKLQSA
jgi:hypothetical protein